MSRSCGALVSGIGFIVEIPPLSTNKRRWFPLGLLSLIAANILGCPPIPQHEIGLQPSTDTAAAAGIASITITSPSSGKTEESTITLTWEVKNFTESAADIGSENIPGFGHTHLYIGEDYTDVTGGSQTLSKLSEGYAIRVVLAQNDHTELDASDDIYVWVEQPDDPFIAITSPTFGQGLDSSSVYLELLILDFELSDDVGSAPEDGIGHYLISVDGEDRDYGVDADGVWVGRLAPGEHTITVELVDNDGTPLSTPTTDTVAVTVSEDATWLQLTSPTFDQEINSSSWPVAVEVENFELNQDAMDSTNTDGQGHYHLYVDGVYQEATAESSTWLDGQEIGEHVVLARLAQNDHTELDVVDHVRISSPADRPGLVIESPPDGEVISSAFTLQNVVENFEIDKEHKGGENEDGHGHIHLYIDDVYIDAILAEDVSIDALESGEHTIRVELAKNDHYPLDEPARDEITITTP